jgi:SAM-dependent methyltransferase
MGTGRLLALLAGDGWKVTGIDAAPGMVELARARVSTGAARLAVEPAERLSWEDAEFEAAVAVGVLEYTEIDSSLRELARVLRPGGRLVVGFRNRAAPMHAWRRGIVHPTARALKRFVRFGRPSPMRRPRPLSIAQIRAALSAGDFRVERVETVGAEVLPDPLDCLVPKLALRAARRAEGSDMLRRVLGADRLVVARRREGRSAP